MNWLIELVEFIVSFLCFISCQMGIFKISKLLKLYTRFHQFSFSKSIIKISELHDIDLNIRYFIRVCSFDVYLIASWVGEKISLRKG